MGECFLYGNGGGGGTKLPFRIFYGTTQPSNPENYDIWIKTSVTVTQVDFVNGTWSAAVGRTIISGLLSGASPSASNTLTYVVSDKTNGIPTYGRLELTGCQQVQGSAGNWVNLDAYRYYGGTWVQFSNTFSATINITYPAESTCTATDGVTKLDAPDTSGTWKCVVPNAGTWTISSTASSFQDEVTITTSGQVAEADVTKLYLQKGSSINYPTNFTNVKTSIIDNGVKYMQNGSSSRATAHFGPLSLTGATKLYVKLTAGYAHASPVPCICVSTSLLTNHPSADLKQFTVGSADSNAGVGVTSGTYVMDISGYSGEYYVALDWEGKSGNNTYLTTEAIWLEV